MGALDARIWSRASAARPDRSLVAGRACAVVLGKTLLAASVLILLGAYGVNINI